MATASVLLASGQHNTSGSKTLWTVQPEHTVLVKWVHLSPNYSVSGTVRLRGTFGAGVASFLTVTLEPGEAFDLAVWWVMLPGHTMYLHNNTLQDTWYHISGANLHGVADLVPAAAQLPSLPDEELPQES